LAAGLLFVHGVIKTGRSRVYLSAKTVDAEFVSDGAQLLFPGHVQAVNAMGNTLLAEHDIPVYVVTMSPSAR